MTAHRLPFEGVATVVACRFALGALADLGLLGRNGLVRAAIFRAAFVVVRLWEERHAVIWLRVRVAAEDNGKGCGSATLPFVRPAAKNAAEAVPPACDAEVVAAGVAAADHQGPVSDLLRLRKAALAEMISEVAKGYDG